MTKPVVLIAEELSPATVEALGPDFDVRIVDGTDRPALLEALRSAQAILVRSATKVDEEAIAAAPHLKVIARAGVGLDNVDIKAATAAGVMVVNAPTSNIISAAELTIGHILSLSRYIPQAHSALAQGQWKRSSFTGTEIFEKTIGIIGLGRIGALIAARMQAFDTKIVAFDPYVTSARAQQLGVQLLSLDELLEQSDFITIHMPKTPETTGMISTEQLARMKSTAYIVNVARGGLIDEDALHHALVNNVIAGAGLDVFVNEPPTGSPLLGLPNIVVTPHLGASTDEAQEKAGVSVAKSVRLALSGELVPDAVNVAGGVIDPYVRHSIACPCVCCILKFACDLPVALRERRCNVGLSGDNKHLPALSNVTRRTSGEVEAAIEGFRLWRVVSRDAFLSEHLRSGVTKPDIGKLLTVNSKAVTSTNSSTVWKLKHLFSLK